MLVERDSEDPGRGACSSTACNKSGERVLPHLVDPSGIRTLTPTYWPGRGADTGVSSAGTRVKVTAEGVDTAGEGLLLHAALRTSRTPVRGRGKPLARGLRRMTQRGVQTDRMFTVQRLVRLGLAPLTRTRLFRSLAPVVMPPIERVFHRVTRGRVQLSALLVPTLVLRSTGAKSGVLRETPLMYTPDGKGRAIVAGTSFARDRHPAWTYNLLAHPDADILVRGRTLHVRARLIGPDDRDEAWRRIEAQWPGYRAYERESGRIVRLFLLQPVDARIAKSVSSDERPAV